jgi:hypothetical protein
LSTAQIAVRRDLIARFQSLRPEVNLTMVNAYSGDLLDLLESGSIDAAIVFGEWHRPGLEWRRVAAAPGYLLLADGDPLSGSGPIRSDQLARPGIGSLPAFDRRCLRPLYEPFVEAGCSLVEAPELAQSSLVSFGALDRLRQTVHLCNEAERARFPNAVRLKVRNLLRSCRSCDGAKRAAAPLNGLWRLTDPRGSAADLGVATRSERPHGQTCGRYLLLRGAAVQQVRSVSRQYYRIAGSDYRTRWLSICRLRCTSLRPLT